MTRSTYNKHRAFAGVLLLMLLCAGANYYLDLGFIRGRQAKGVLLLIMGIMIVYFAYFCPTRRDMREHSGRPSEGAKR